MSCDMCHVQGVKCQVSCVRCPLSWILCHVSCVTCRMSLSSTATAMDPPPAHSPTVHSRMVCKDQKISFFSRGNSMPFNIQNCKVWDHCPVITHRKGIFVHTKKKVRIFTTDHIASETFSPDSWLDIFLGLFYLALHHTLSWVYTMPFMCSFSSTKLFLMYNIILSRLLFSHIPGLSFTFLNF